MNAIKKTLFTLRVDNYSPEICDITYPFLKHYAKKIGADFFVIDKRKFPDFPVMYEKLQIYELAKQMKNDWNMYLDSDALVHPNALDYTAYLRKDTIAHYGLDFGNMRFAYDHNFLRDGRNIGSAGWCVIASDWCVDLWTPLDIPLEEALKAITPTNIEQERGTKPSHLLDEYIISRNIARFGLKVTTIEKIMAEVMPFGNCFYHNYTLSEADKIKVLKEIATKMM
jgi:hypothetical protein